MTRIHNRTALKDVRKELRNNSTKAETKLWKHLKKSMLLAYKFRRQQSIGSYIVDFYCPEKRLAVELDGKQHFASEQKEYDEERTKILDQLNIRVVRFTNKEIMDDIDYVLGEIIQYLSTPVSPPP